MSGSAVNYELSLAHELLEDARLLLAQGRYRSLTGLLRRVPCMRGIVGKLRFEAEQLYGQERQTR
jgi:hypothetical protein